MGGMAWIDRAALRISRLDGSLFEDVTFGWGLLGRLNKGGTFSVMQRQVGDDHWEVISLDVKMFGHAVIFKSINVRQLQRITDFHRINDNMTISEAYQLLEKGETSPSLPRTRAGTAIPKADSSYYCASGDSPKSISDFRVFLV